MNSDDLIKNLASDLKPVKRQNSPNVFAVRCMVFLLVIMIVGILSLRLRHNFSVEILNLKFIMDIFLSLLVLLSGVFLTAWFSTAEKRFNQNYKFLMLFLFTSILGLNAYRLSLTSFYFKNLIVSSFDIKCFAIAIIFSVSSIILMTITISKRIVFNAGLVGAMIGFLSFSVGSFVINMHCPITLDQHVAIYHAILPMLLGTLLGYFSGKTFLKM